jgi:hypothetical protein
MPSNGFFFSRSKMGLSSFKYKTELLFKSTFFSPETAEKAETMIKKRKNEKKENTKRPTIVARTLLRNFIRIFFGNVNINVWYMKAYFYI